MADAKHLDAVRPRVWACWIIAALISAIGLRHFHVSNSMDAWMPDLATTGPYVSYIVVGFPTNAVDSSTLANRLRTLSTVEFCLDPATLRAAQVFSGVSPENFVTGEDGKYSGIYCFRRPTATNKAFIDEVEGVLGSTSPTEVFAVGGPAIFQQAMDDWSQYRLDWILIAILVVGGGMLLMITHRISVALASMAAIACSSLIFVGGLSWLRIPLDMSLSLVPPMMMALGFSYSAHRALRRQSLSLLIACGFAAACGTASFATADLLPVRHFAIAGVPGVLLVWLATITLVSPNHHARRARVLWLRRMRNACLSISLRLRWPIIALAMLLTVTGIAMAPHLHFEDNALTFFPATSRITRDFATLDRRLTGMLPSQVVVKARAGDRETADPRATLIATKGMRKVIDITPWLRGSSGRTYWCLADNDAISSLANAQGDWQKWARAHQVALEWHGVAAQIDRSGRSIFHTAELALPTILLLIAVIIGGYIRQLWMVFAGVWVAALPVAGLTLIVVILKWRLGATTMMIGSIAIGIALDDVLHLLLTYRRRGSLVRTVVTCWKPCVGSSLATALCFSLFMISPFGPTSQFGKLMALAAILGMLANQLVLAACLSFGGRSSPSTIAAQSDSEHRR